MHHLANRLLAIAAAVVPEQQPAHDTVAQLIRAAEPLREAVLLREDDTVGATREVDWELRSLVYRVLTVVELLEVHHPHVVPAGSPPFRSMRDLVVDTVTTWLDSKGS